MRRFPGPLVLLVLSVAVSLAGCGDLRSPDPGAAENVSVAAGSAVPAVVGEQRATLSPDEVHSVHAPYGIPVGTLATNDLIFRHSYTASTNDRTRFADWVAYVVRPSWMEDAGDPDRTYRTDPVLDDDETLEGRPGMGDYEEAHAEHGYDRGHLVPLASFQSSPFVDEVNFLSVLAPQTDALNRGPWRSLEFAVRRLSARAGVVYVLAGPLYDADSPMPPLPGADENHLVPTAFWTVVYAAPAGAPATAPAAPTILPRAASFIVPQRLQEFDGPETFLASVDDIEESTGLDLFSLIDDPAEEALESVVSAEWFASW